MRARIKETAQEMGYQQTPSAHKTRSGDTGNVGILIPSCFIGNTNNSFYWELYEKVVSRLLMNDYYGILELLPEEAEHNIEVTPDMALHDRDCRGEITFTLPEKLPTTFACNCDRTAYEGINKLKERGLSVPDDVSVAGFDNYSLPLHRCAGAYHLRGGYAGLFSKISRRGFALRMYMPNMFFIENKK